MENRKTFINFWSDFLHQKGLSNYQSVKAAIVFTDQMEELHSQLSGSNGNVWVKVEDDFPEKAKPVLIATKHWIGVGYYKKNFELDIEDEPDWSEENGEYIFEGSVTHWMPLPAPPNKDETPIKSNDVGDVKKAADDYADRCGYSSI